MKSFLPLFAIAVSLIFIACGASKELTAEAEASKSALAECRRELNTALSDLDKAKAMMGGNQNQVSQLEMENQSLKDQLAAALAEMASTKGELDVVTRQMQASSDNYGVWYRVQIGAFGKRRVDTDLQTTDQLSLETTDDLQKTVLGRYRNYDDAKELKDHLVSIGLKDAWIVSYKDGKRVSIEEARGN